MNEFTGKANVYDKARPGYAPAALDFILGLASPNAVVADIGAGTGKFSAMLAARGCEVIAVEPNADMRSKLPVLENLRIVNGTAEATGLPDHSVDAVTCAQAFHWFDGEKFKAECERILKPGGRIFVVYNNPVGHERHDELIWHSKDGPPGSHWLEREERLRDFFSPGMRHEIFPNPVSYDARGWLDYMLSHSMSPRPGEEVYERFADSVRLIFTRHNEDGQMLLPLETVVYTSL
ncbi:MAG: class I SAM-dependent methyltransferase [Firmicutes bacterium]|nr:class I SAM-dependent methyltransferase [Bacillota bacterium]